MSEHQVRLLATLAVARELSKVRLEVRIEFRSNFGVKQSPRNTVLKLSGQIRLTSLQVTPSEVSRS